MSAYLGEIRIFGGNFAPVGWLFCDGQLLPISENDALFTLIGTTYGGDGESTFALPDLRARVPIHQGSGSGLSSRVLSETGGVESVTLTTIQTPAHRHTVQGSANLASRTSPTNGVLATTQASTITPYGTDAPLVTLSPSAITSTGGSQPHENLQPYLAINFIIATSGIFPSQA